MSRVHTFRFADLAGFTALTEAHGDDYAADLAERFCAALNQRLPDGAEDFKMLGDACLVRVDDARAAAVQRGRDWFGTTVNTASRVADLAAADEALLTEATRLAAGEPPGIVFDDLGVRALRNLAAPQRLYRAARPPDHGGEAP